MHSIIFRGLMFAVLLTPMSIASSPCSYKQQVDAGKVYYIYNPEYPKLYHPGTSCRWEIAAESHVRINLTCEIDLPKSNNCAEDRFSISTPNDYTKFYCGRGQVSVNHVDALILEFSATKYTEGGRFLCTLTSVLVDEAISKCDCGWKRERVPLAENGSGTVRRKRIVGGVESGVNEYPAMAGLVDIAKKAIYCRASIISDRYVLTAAHCRRPVEEILLVVGEHDVSSGVDTNATVIYTIKKIIPHPNYTRADRGFDIAVVQTHTRIVFSDYVGPICLPFNYANLGSKASTLTALGWGSTHFGGPTSDTLRAVNLTIVPLASCNAVMSKTIRSSQICTNAKEEKDTCQADSGGPLYFFDSRLKRLILVGIISYGMVCATKLAVNTRVASFLPWIVSITENANYCIK